MFRDSNFEKFFTTTFEIIPFNYDWVVQQTEDGIGRYIENPEWTKKQNEKKIQRLKELIESHEEAILEARKQLKELEKETPK